MHCRRGAWGSARRFVGVGDMLMLEHIARILLVIGGLVGLYGFARYVMVIYGHGYLWLLFCLVVLPVGYVAFLLLHPRESLKPLLILVAGIALQFIGYLLHPEIAGR